MRSALRTAAMIAAAAATLAGCGSSSSSSSTSGNTVDITAANIMFSTTDIKVPVGATTFVVKNTDNLEHNLTIANANVNKDVAGGKTVSAKVTLKAGVYAFHCEYHPDVMKGTITVS